MGDLSNIENSQLEWLASVSPTPRFEAELRKRKSEEAQVENSKEYLAWLADVAPEKGADIRRASGTTIGPNAELLEFVRSIMTDEDSFTCEQVWDESKHQRVKSGRNAGQFTFANGSAAGGGTSGSKSSNNGSDEAADSAFQFAGWHPPVGHHWVPIGVFMDPEIRRFLSPEAMEYAAGNYSGPTIPHHGNTTIEQITHPIYSAEVKK
jgi:hypothetical protein